MCDTSTSLIEELAALNQLTNTSIRDLIYFDFERSASIYSQVAGGLVQEIKSEAESGSDERNVRKYNVLGLFEPEFGGISTQKKSEIETKILHHDLLVKLEEVLFKATLAVDISALKAQDYQTLRDQIEPFHYVRVEGWAALEDFRRLTKSTARFHDLARFVGMCRLQGPEFQEQHKKVLEEFEAARKDIGTISDKNKRKTAEARLKKAEDSVAKEVEALISTSGVPTWLTDGLQFFVDTFLPDSLNVRIAPFRNLPSFQVIAGLKRDCLVDGDIETLVFSYGTKPNVKLTLFGLITSFPSKGDESFDFVDPPGDGEDADAAAFHGAFRGMFDALEGFEKFVRFSRYPNITIQPIAMYRNVGLKREDASNE